jgi:hypothetical protein
MPKGRKPKTEDFDFNKLLQPAGEELRRTLGSLLHAELESRGDNVTSVAGNLNLRLKRVRTRNQNGDATYFRLHEDALILVADIVASEELLKADINYDANFQIIDRSTNSVIKDRWLRELRFDHGNDYWICMGKAGSCAEEYTTPGRWGLDEGLYGFRAVLEIEGLGTLCRSDETLFRIRYQ